MAWSSDCRESLLFQRRVPALLGPVYSQKPSLRLRGQRLQPTAPRSKGIPASFSVDRLLPKGPFCEPFLWNSAGPLLKVGAIPLYFFVRQVCFPLYYSGFDLMLRHAIVGPFIDLNTSSRGQFIVRREWSIMVFVRKLHVNVGQTRSEFDFWRASHRSKGIVIDHIRILGSETWLFLRWNQILRKTYHHFIITGCTCSYCSRRGEDEETFSYQVSNRHVAVLRKRCEYRQPTPLLRTLLVFT